MPAETFGLKNRGIIREGMYADIVVFDINDIKDRATFEEPYQSPLGIEHVIVNGVPVIRNGKFAGSFPGRVLRCSD